jgi:TPP-dependent pyruvate/acetoin dehydrogenase alpha subunit
MTAIPSLDLYKGLFLARRSEEYIIKHYPEDLMRTPMHMSMGQEFICVGVCVALEGKADVFASYRSHAAFLAQTRDTDRFFGELYGRTTGTADGKSGSMHLAQPERGHILSSGVVASQISVALGAAFANRQLNTGRTAVAFFGDGAVDAGVFWEAINSASLFHLPVLLVCEDNDLAVNTRRSERHAFKSLGEVAAHFGCDVYEDNSNDVESVYTLARSAAELAHRTRRPALLDIKCCRYLEHVGIGKDWNTGYRDEATFQKEWFSRDSLAVQRRRLLAQGVSEATILAVETDVEQAIQESVKRASLAPVPARERLYAGVFHEEN